MFHLYCMIRLREIKWLFQGLKANKLVGSRFERCQYLMFFYYFLFVSWGVEICFSRVIMTGEPAKPRFALLISIPYSSTPPQSLPTCAFLATRVWCGVAGEGMLCCWPGLRETVKESGVCVGGGKQSQCAWSGIHWYPPTHPKAIIPIYT